MQPRFSNRTKISIGGMIIIGSLMCAFVIFIFACMSTVGDDMDYKDVKVKEFQNIGNGIFFLPLTASETCDVDLIGESLARLHADHKIIDVVPEVPGGYLVITERSSAESEH